MRGLERDPGTPLLLRQASGPAAILLVEAMGGPHRELASAAGGIGAVVLWLGDVAVADAVPLALAVIVLDGDGAELAGVVLPARWRGYGLGARLAREVLVACRARGCRWLAAVVRAGDCAASLEFRRLLTAGLALDPAAGSFVL